MKQMGYCTTYADHMRQICACTCLAKPTTPPPKATCKSVSVSSARAGAVNLILVPSGFDNLDKWGETVQDYFKFMSKYPPLDAANISMLNVWYVDAAIPGDVGNFCWFNCGNIQRLLCCSSQKMKDHAREHCGSGFFQNLLVIHNSPEYGGAGGAGMGTTSVHPASRAVAVHEMGHSLFGLTDEYTYGGGRPSDLNCAAAGCDDWKDLIGRWGVGCIPNSCENGKHFASEETIMKSVYDSFGEVNERITCCKYLFYDTNTVPGYCEKFNKDGLDLMGYCRGKVWKGKEPQSRSNALLEAEFDSQLYREHLRALAQDPQGAKMDFVEDPQEWHLDRTEDGAGWVCTKTDVPVRSGVYLKAEVDGEEDDDDGTHRSLVQHSRDHDIEVEVLDAEGSVLRTLTFHSAEAAEVPPDDDGLWKDGDALVDRPHLDVILKAGERCRVKQASSSASGSD